MSPVPGPPKKPSLKDFAFKPLSMDERQGVDKLLGEYLKTVGASYVMLVDRQGVMLTIMGEVAGIDTQMVAALVAGSFEVSRQIARALKRQPFASILQEGPRDNLLVCLINDDTVLGVVYDTRTTLGMVRLYAKSLTQNLQGRFSRFAPSQV